jgi:hypothetical protein
MGIKTIYLTAEETEQDLRNRAPTLLPLDQKKLSFLPSSASEADKWLEVVRYPLERSGASTLGTLQAYFEKLKRSLEERASLDSEQTNASVPLPCSTIIVLDGLHEVATQALLAGSIDSENAHSFNSFLEKCRELKALVVLTTGIDWDADKSLDYLVDTSIRLSHEGGDEEGLKPQRLITLTKSRHQLCSPGSHGFQISGQKGVRFTPQMNYQLDRLSIWNPRLPDKRFHKRTFCRHFVQDQLWRFSDTSTSTGLKDTVCLDSEKRSVKIFRGSNVFINGLGSGGKASLALKLATSPQFNEEGDAIERSLTEKILVVSFLYPQDYYENIAERLAPIQKVEYAVEKSQLPEGPQIDVLHLYPGHLKPDVLFNRIYWKIEQAALLGEKYTTVIVDGIHNVFLQFPAIENQTLFWPQLYSLLRTFDLSLIVTHTFLAIRHATFKSPRQKAESQFDVFGDGRSDPLRHSLVSKTDFHFEVDPKPLSEDSPDDSNSFVVEPQSAIGQSLPQNVRRNGSLLWNRERLVFFINSDQSEMDV